MNKHQFLRRESCEAMLGPGESASFDFTNTTGLLVQISGVAIDDPNARGGRGGLEPDGGDIVPTLEVREGLRS